MKTESYENLVGIWELNPFLRTPVRCPIDRRSPDEWCVSGSVSFLEKIPKPSLPSRNPNCTVGDDNTHQLFSHWSYPLLLYVQPTVLLI